MTRRLLAATLLCLLLVSPALMFGQGVVRGPYLAPTAGLNIASVSRLPAQVAGGVWFGQSTAATQASYVITANVLVTASTTHSFNVDCQYTDEGGTARTIHLPFAQLAGTVTPTIANAGGAVPYAGIPVQIHTQANSSISIVGAGTFTSVTFNVEGSITQVS